MYLSTFMLFPRYPVSLRLHKMGCNCNLMFILMEVQMRTNPFCFLSKPLQHCFFLFFNSHNAHLSSPPHLFFLHTLSFSHSRDSYFLLSGAVACERCVLMGRKSRMFTFGCVGAFCFHRGLPCGSSLKNTHTCTRIPSLFLLQLSFSCVFACRCRGNVPLHLSLFS